MQNVTDLIPHRPPFLFVDKIVSETSDSLTASRTFRADEDFYEGHYPGAPITPGVLLCEAVFQAGALYMARQAQASGAKVGEGVPLLAKISEVRFRNPVYPGETIMIEVKKKEFEEHQKTKIAPQPQASPGTEAPKPARPVFKPKIKPPNT